MSLPLRNRIVAKTDGSKKPELNADMANCRVTCALLFRVMRANSPAALVSSP
jgi:hypothetical protein